MTRSESDHAILLRDFANTLDVETGEDELGDPDRLAIWLHRRALIPGVSAPTTADVETARVFRAGLRTAMRAHHGRAQAGYLAELADAAVELPLRVTGSGDVLGLAPMEPGVRGGLAHIAIATVAVGADGTWERLKICAADTCQWAFVDSSKNRSRQWCSMRVCGNRTKTRAYRARKATGATS